MALAIKPAYADAHINRGKIAIDHKKYELGEKACLKAIEADPAIAHPYVNLCMLKRLQGQFDRSEEHTSELQSLMRISYAVFCLKKKTIHRLSVRSDSLNARHLFQWQRASGDRKRTRLNSRHHYAAHIKLYTQKQT